MIVDDNDFIKGQATNNGIGFCGLLCTSTVDVRSVCMQFCSLGPAVSAKKIPLGFCSVSGRIMFSYWDRLVAPAVGSRLRGDPSSGLITPSFCFGVMDRRSSGSATRVCPSATTRAPLPAGGACVPIPTLIAAPTACSRRGPSCSDAGPRVTTRHAALGDIDRLVRHHRSRFLI